MKKTTLQAVHVRLVRAEERDRYEQVMEQHHYLGWGKPVGETMLYVACVGELWVGLVSFGAAAYALKDRDERIGWSIEQRQRRLNFITQNRRFLILDGGREPNMASRVLGLCAHRLAHDWEQKYGHPVLAVETFVDLQRFEGTCYRAAGWQTLGTSVGAQRVYREFYDESGTPKRIFLKTLQPDAFGLLCAEEFPENWRVHELEARWKSPVKTEQSRSLWSAFARVPEFRRARGLRHSVPATLACGACAVLGGAEGIGEMAEMVSHLERRQLRALRCWRNPRTGKYEPPSESTLRRVFRGIDVERFDQEVAAWSQRHGIARAVAMDGKALRGCLDEEQRPLFLVSAVEHGTGALQGQVQVDSKSNEIPAARELLDRMPPLDGTLVTGDAAHTNAETARKIVMDKGGDYLLPIKGNQPGLLNVAQHHLPVSAFSPSALDDRKGQRPYRHARDSVHGNQSGVGGLPFLPPTCVDSSYTPLSVG
jgi:predicted transposase YbfD/YdcC